MSKAMIRAAGLALHVEHYLTKRNILQCSMTDATEAIWGTSGRGNPNAVRLIEATADMGFLCVQRAARGRIVYRTSKPIPQAAIDQYSLEEQT